MKNINQSDFSSHISSNKYVVVKFSAPWCGPCRALTPMMDKLSEDITDVSFVEVNVDENPSLAAQFNIRNIPTTLGWKDGQVQWMKVGLPSPNDLRQVVEQLRAS